MRLRCILSALPQDLVAASFVLGKKLAIAAAQAVVGQLRMGQLFLAAAHLPFLATRTSIVAVGGAGKRNVLLAPANAPRHQAWYADEGCYHLVRVNVEPLYLISALQD